MVVGVYTRLDLQSWLEAARVDQRPGLAPYGLEHLAGEGRKVTQLTWRTPEAAMVGRSVRRLESRLGFPLASTLLARRATTRVDVALGVLEREGYAHGVLRRAGVRPWSQTPLALLTCWLAEEARVAADARLRALRRLAGGADVYIFWSSNQRTILRDRLKIPDERLICIPFGVEAEFYRPSSARGEYVLAAGRDRARDYATFLDAVSGVDAPVKLVSPPRLLRGMRIPKNVELLGEVDHVRFRGLLEHAAVVVVPSKPDVAYPSGQSVLLNAMSCQRPTVVSWAPALRDYVRDRENTCAVAPQDSPAMRAGIELVLRDRDFAARIAAGGRADVERVYNTRMMWGAIARRLEATVLANRGMQ